MKESLTSFTIALAITGAASAQGLYNIMPYDDEPLDASPITWTVGASLGFDDNASPTGTDVPGGPSKVDTSYIAAFAQANYASVQPQTTWDIWARVGGSYYFDEVPTASATGTEDVFYDLGLGVNIVHRVTERLRLRSRSDVSYQVEPDYSTGIGTDRRIGQYLRYSTDNSVGYSWTERFGTVTGYRIHGVNFDDIDRSDYVNHLFYNQFRYRLSPATVLTASFRYSTQSNDTGRDSDSYFALVGAEHKFSPTTVGVLRVGAQFFDGTSSSTSPYVEAMLRTRVNEQFSLRGFIRYGIEDRGTNISYFDTFGTTIVANYDERTVLRVGTQATYQLSPVVSLFGGANVVFSSRDDLLSGGGPSSFDEEIYNFNVGASYKAMENLFFNGSYNFTKSESDGRSREYDRNRFNLGVQTTF